MDLKQQLLKLFKNNSKAEFYINRYIKFINQCKQFNSTNDISTQVQHIHHIVPKSWGGSNGKTNLITLTFKQHVVAHSILSRTGCSKMISALHVLLYNQAVNKITIAWREAELKRSLKAVTKQVVDLNTGKIYHSVSAAEKDGYRCVGNAILHNRRVKGHFFQYVSEMQGADFENELQRLQEKFDQLAKQKIERQIARCSRPVVNLNTRQVFDNIVSAVGTKKSAMVIAAIKKTNRAFGCFWQYVSDLRNQSIDDELQHVNDILQERNKRKHRQYQQQSRSVINITTGEKFESVTEASRIYSLKVMSSLQQAIDKYHYCKKCIWCYGDNDPEQYLSEFNNVNAKRKANVTKERISRTNPNHQIINLNTGEVFKNCGEAARSLNLETLWPIQSAIRQWSRSKGCYWMRVGDMTNTREFHLQQRINMHGKRK